MQAIRFHTNGGPEVLQIDEIPVPAPKTGEVLVRVEAAGVNYADTVRRWGDHYPLPTPLPFVSGGEVVGIVETVGDDTLSPLIGRRVFAAPACGGYAEYCVLPASLVFAFPDGIDPVSGVALCIQGLSAALILKRAGRLQHGEAVLVEGAAGGVGSLAVQLARLYGAGTIIGAASSASKRDRVLALGADSAVDYGHPNWSSAVRESTGGRGADVVLEMTGGDVFREALDCLAPGGRVVVFGIASRTPFLVPTDRLIGLAQSVVGFYLGHYFSNRELIEQTLDELVGFVKEGRLRIEIGGVFGLADAAAAHRQLEGRQSSGKLILIPGCARETDSRQAVDGHRDS